MAFRDERTPSGAGDDQAVSHQRVQRLADGGSRDSVLRCQFRDGRQRLPWLKLASLDPSAKVGSDSFARQFERLTTRHKLIFPNRVICHPLFALFA